MNSLRDRLSLHAARLDKHEEMEAALAGVFVKEAQVVSEEFSQLIRGLINPVFKEFKSALRDLGRDAVVVTSVPQSPVQSIALILRDRYLSFGVGKTIKLVNPKEDISKAPNTKFYEVFRVHDTINIRQRYDTAVGVVTTPIPYNELNQAFLENELASFFERAYPTPL